MVLVFSYYMYGLFTIYVVRDMSRCELLQLLIDIDDGSHVNRTKVEVYKAVAYRNEPDLSTNKQGLYSLDGEKVDYGPIQGNILPSQARVKKLV